MVHGTLQFFFRNKTFLFVKIESWNFQQLFDLGFRETLQNFSSFRKTFRRHFSTGNKSCFNDLKFCEVSWNNKSKRCWKFQTNKSFIPKKILSVPCTMNSSFFSQQMALWRPNFPHQRLWEVQEWLYNFGTNFTALYHSDYTTCNFSRWAIKAFFS